VDDLLIPAIGADVSAGNAGWRNLGEAGKNRFSGKGYAR
jgi:hypothetical protein